MMVVTRRHELNAGMKFEREFLGISAPDVHTSIGGKRIAGGLRQAMFYVKGIQPSLGWNPKEPKTSLSQAFFGEVSGLLSHPEKLRMFCAVGTPLDWRGIDLWLEYGRTSSNRRFVTIDLTTKRFKRHRSDLLLSLVHFKEDWYIEVAREAALILDS